MGLIQLVFHLRLPGQGPIHCLVKLICFRRGDIEVLAEPRDVSQAGRGRSRERRQEPFPEWFPGSYCGFEPKPGTNLIRRLPKTKSNALSKRTKSICDEVPSPEDCGNLQATGRCVLHHSDRALFVA